MHLQNTWTNTDKSIKLKERNCYLCVDKRYDIILIRVFDMLEICSVIVSK